MPSCYDSYACLFGKMRKRHEHRTMTVYHRRSTVSDLVISPSDQDEVLSWDSNIVPMPLHHNSYDSWNFHLCQPSLIANISRPGDVRFPAVHTATVAPSKF